MSGNRTLKNDLAIQLLVASGHQGDASMLHPTKHSWTFNNVVMFREFPYRMVVWSITRAVWSLWGVHVYHSYSSEAHRTNIFVFCDGPTKLRSLLAIIDRPMGFLCDHTISSDTSDHYDFIRCIAQIDKLFALRFTNTRLTFTFFHDGRAPLKQNSLIM